MAMRSADAAAIGRASLILRRASRYFSDGKSGRVLGEEEKAAENIFIQVFQMVSFIFIFYSVCKSIYQPALPIVVIACGNNPYRLDLECAADGRRCGQSSMLRERGACALSDRKMVEDGRRERGLCIESDGKMVEMGFPDFGEQKLDE
ncbi:hypothetical protein ACLOJK_030244 [Asimina triloba]